MKKHSHLVITLAISILFVLTACNLPFTIGQKAASTEENNENQSEPSEGIFGNTQSKVDPNPVGLQDGLGSLDSYRLRFQMISSDNSGKYSNSSEFIERSVVDKSTHSLMESTTFDPENDSEEDTSTTEIYEVGLVTCTSSGDDDWTYSEMTNEDKELADIFKGMVDIVPVMQNPQFVGEETVNDIPANHFTFKIEGIGTDSGAVASINEGEYWLAKDGQYIVKYNLTLEIHSSDDSTISKMEVLMEMSDINSDIIDIQQPSGCVKTE
ncbi:MAG: hypothetical protein AB9897_02970 [Anaerolineaceae bacterium]